jgi:acetoin utilization deacetylase AcuC-like enzyme
VGAGPPCPATARAGSTRAASPGGDDATVNAPLSFHHPAYLEHDPRAHAPSHPDTPERLAALERHLESTGWLGWERRRAPAASEAQLELVHSAGHVRAIRELCDAGAGRSTPTRTSARPLTARHCTPSAARARW